MNQKHKTEPQLYSIPVIEKITIPNRAEMLAKIESGELDHIDFPACVYIYGPNTNYLTFLESDLPAFAQSFIGQPFLRDHDTWSIESRDGTLIESAMNGTHMQQTIRLTTRRGMTAYIEGQIDRFSIGWYKDDVICTICNSSWYGPCPHWPGQTYDTATGKQTCLLLSINPKGKETSAVNAPAVQGTGLLQEMHEYKLSINGDPADDQTTKGEPMFKLPKPMLEAAKDQATGTSTATGVIAELREGLEIMKLIQSDAERTAAQQAELEESRQIRLDQCSLLLDAALQTSRLPEITQSRLRKQFEGKIFKLSELQITIEEARTEVSALTAGLTVNGPGRGLVSGMFSGEDEFRAAVDDLLQAPREHNMEGKKVRRLSGIREAYLMGSGDVNFHGNYDPTQTLGIFSLGSTATFPGVVKDSLNKILIRAWKKYGAMSYGWWQKVVTIEHFDNLNQIDWLRFGTIGSLPVVAEGAEYTELPIGDNTETSDWTKYGGYVGLTLEAILRDDVRAFRKMPDEVALGAMRNISEQFAAIFTVNSGAGPTLADGGALFNATAVTVAGGHANLLTAALGTDYTAWRAISNAMFKQPMLVKNAAGYYGTGKKQGVRPKYSLVPADLGDQAGDLFLSRQDTRDNKNAENRLFNEVFPLVVPEWTDANDFAAVADPQEVPTLMLGEIFGVEPEIFIAGRETDPAMFANDESRIKVRQFLATGVSDYRGLHKENV